MEKIEILRTKNISTSFNINTYIAMMTELNLGDDSSEIQLNAEILLANIREFQLFDEQSKDIFLIRQLLSTSFFALDQESTENPIAAQLESTGTMMPVKRANKSTDKSVEENIKIRIDKIVLGSKYNIPANVDIIASKITNIPQYNFNIDLSSEGLKRLVRKAKQLYFIKSFARRMYSPVSAKTKPGEIIISSKNKKNNPFTNLGEINKYLFNVHHATSSENIDLFIEQLRSAGIIEILRELINGNTGKIAKYLSSKIGTTMAIKRNENSIINYYNEINRFNRLVTIMNKSQKSYSDILKAISEKNIKSLARLRSILNKDQMTRISKLLELRVGVQNECSHINAFKKFYKTYKKEEYFGELERLRDYIEYDDVSHIFRCKKCNDFLYCDHNIDFANSSNDYMQMRAEVKEKLSEKYRDRMIVDFEQTIYCKYCGEKLYRQENDEIINSGSFNALMHAKGLESNKDSELAVLKDESYSAIRRVLDDFIFKYDFNKISLIKNIQYAVLDGIFKLLVKLKITLKDDNFNSYAQMLSMVFGYIYMFDIYSKDQKIYLRESREAREKLDINKYAKMFGEKVLGQFKRIISEPSRLKSYIEAAYLALKNESRANLDIITEHDIAFFIISNPVYNMLYYYYNIEKAGKAREVNVVDAYRGIVLTPKPSMSNFWHNSYAPVSAFWKRPGLELMADVYQANLNYSNPCNYIHRVTTNMQFPDDLYGYERQEFDPTIQNRLFKHDAERDSMILKQRYLSMILTKSVNPYIPKLVPLCYVYDETAKIRVWEPVFDDKHNVIDYKNDKITLSKLKCDDKLNTEISKKLFTVKPLLHLSKPIKPGKIVMPKKESKKTETQFNIIKTINNNFNINQLKYIGQSSGVPQNEFFKGNIEEGKYSICAYRLNYYINYFIGRYNHLRYHPGSMKNIHYFESTNMLAAIDSYTPDKFPDIEAEKIQNYRVDDLKSFYEFQQTYLVDVISKLYNAKDKIINRFLIDVVTDILNIDKLYCKNDAVIVDNIEIGDEDAIGNNEFQEEVNEEDEGFIDQDEIDYEQDEDEIPDD